MKKKYFYSPIAALVIYIVIILAPIDYRFTEFFKFYSPILFALVLIAYAAAFRIAGHGGQILALSLTAILFGLALSYMWRSGHSDNKIIGGLLPCFCAHRPPFYSTLKNERL